MRTTVAFVLLCLQLSCLAVYGQTPGGQQSQNVTITPQLKKLVNAGLQQANALGGNFTIDHPKEVIVMSYTTQVVAGTLSNILMEVRFKRGSKLISVELFDQAWSGIVNQLNQACVLVAKSGDFYSSRCSSAADCQTLLTSNGQCQDPTN